MNENKLCVAYGADDNYAKYLGISMLSLFQTNKDFDEINVFVMDCGIEEANKEKLVSIAKEYNRVIQFISMKDYVDGLDLNMGARKISTSSYARLFLASVIPPAYNRILYLDCDTIVTDTIAEYWNTNLDGYMAAGVRDTVDKYFLKKIGLTQEHYYVNAGILLINLEAWRESKIQQQFMAFIRKFNGNVPHHDQGTINAVCSGKILTVAPRYNVTSNVYTFPAKTIKRMYFMDSFYEQKELDEARKNPAILHYTTGLVGRPWEEKCTHPRKGAYIKAAKKSPWRDDKILPDSRSLGVRAFAALYRYTPKFVSETAYRLSNWLLHIRD